MNVDYNLLYNFIVIAKSPNLKTASQRLNRSEGALSKDIAKLRDRFNDPLIQRVNGKNELSPFAKTFLPKLQIIFNQFEEALLPKEYKASDYNGRLKIAINTHTLEAYGYEIYKNLVAIFPQAQISVKSWNKHTEQSILDETVDFGLHVFNPERNKSIRQILIKEFELSFITSKDYPANNIEELKERGMVRMMLPGWNDHKHIINDKLNLYGLNLKKQIEIESYQTALSIVLNSDLFMLAPVEFAKQSEGFLSLPMPNYDNVSDLSIHLNVKSNLSSSPMCKDVIKAISNALR
ncbi:LysR family transcriptional regulator [Shewanella olleyana]|uniref:LysR family transcriptional regulator n=1 Tax=Shewanella olleyana TaxID=135626 RepID=UPI0020100EF9|nr:LysR family transcriptional regulator [Shewanella olleyana]MCL1066305.1 LysR family transcriptional regulator [Shewanella olleyana]